MVSLENFIFTVMQLLKQGVDNTSAYHNISISKIIIVPYHDNNV